MFNLSNTHKTTSALQDRVVSKNTDREDNKYFVSWWGLVLLNPVTAETERVVLTSYYESHV